MSAKKWMARKYGLAISTIANVQDERLELADRHVSSWRNVNGLPATNSPLCRGYFLETLAKEPTLTR